MSLQARPYSGHSGPANLVIFDAYNTVVTSHPDYRGTFLEGLAHAGMDPSPGLLEHLQAASEGIAHVESSVSRDSYQAWANETLRLAGLTRSHQPVAFAERIVPALEQLHQAPMVQMPEAEACLATLKAAGCHIAICSNWGWDLRRDLEPTGLAEYIDYFISSARVGYRKPHRRLYEMVLKASTVCAENAVFVGDNLRADVLGPQRAGIRAIHLTSSPAVGFIGEHVSSLAAVAALLDQ